ncbi:hypothetical protein [Streptomyces sp. bgisy022]|uniref:hypothetical protein n=1 Tax=Streptomyces sp. bgisy022 TaxID=3413769 RepID=UPI003D7308D4
MKHKTANSALILTSSLALLSLTISGCSAAGYEIPSEICGRKIDPSSLEPLLPSGAEFEAEHTIDDDLESACHIFVDKADTLAISELRNQNRFDVMEFVMADARLFKNPRKSAVGDDTVTSDDWLISMNACTGHGKMDYYVVDVTLATKAGEETSRHLEQFIRSYLPEGMKKMGCTE